MGFGCSSRCAARNPTLTLNPTPTLTPDPDPTPSQVLSTLRSRLQEALAQRPLSFREFKRAVARAEHGCSDTRSSHSHDTPRGPPAAHADPRDLTALLGGLQAAGAAGTAGIAATAAGGLEAFKSISSSIGDFSSSLFKPGR